MCGRAAAPGYLCPRRRATLPATLNGDRRGLRGRDSSRGAAERERRAGHGGGPRINGTRDRTRGGAVYGGRSQERIPPPYVEEIVNWRFLRMNNLSNPEVRLVLSEVSTVRFDFAAKLDYDLNSEHSKIEETSGKPIYGLLAADGGRDKRERAIKGNYEGSEENGKTTQICIVSTGVTPTITRSRHEGGHKLHLISATRFARLSIRRRGLLPSDPELGEASIKNAGEAPPLGLLDGFQEHLLLASLPSTNIPIRDQSGLSVTCINLRLILVSGKTKEFLFSPSDSAGDIAQHVFDNWPEDWCQEAVSKAEILRLIYQGRFLHSNVTLGALGLPFGKTTVMHLVPRENLPEPNSQDQRQKSKGGNSSCCSASCCIL
ncbi:hypothetical protein MTP99_011913 [Tenebrio molitor]|nr:hypothetical protein MTP99_011913 [Tenebrio molitor]